MTLEKKQISRRTVAKGAAWTVPAIVAAGALPIAAATPPTGCTEIEDDIIAAPGSSNNYFSNNERTVYTWTNTYGVPLEVSYDIAGGGGGVNWNDGAQTGSEPGGSGHRLTGTLLVPPGITLTLIAGNGGIGVSDVGNAPGAPAMNALILGGQGYGNGGDMKLGDQPFRYAAGSGGGGSAILVGTGASAKPILVAGGGGGAGGGIATSPPFFFTQDASGGHGGLPAGLAGGSAQGRIGTGASRVNYIARGAGGASAGTGGQPYANHAEGNPTGDFTYTGVGNAGSNHGGDGINGGGNGAQATVAAAWAYVTSGAGQYTPGAGGGGYAGGASGNWTTARASVPAGGAVIGGGGGGGSSFVAPSAINGVTVVSQTPGLANNGTAQPRRRNPGWARIKFGTCV